MLHICRLIVNTTFIICLISVLVAVIYEIFLSKHWYKFHSPGVYSTGGINASCMWCYNYSIGGKMCKFKNLYYLPSQKQFLFFFDSDSVIRGVNDHHDLMQLELSSVLFHNKFLMNLAVVSKNNFALHRNLIFENSVFILWRFKWDNIMHVIHDDLLPLYEAYSHLCTGDIDECVSKNRLAFADEGDYGPLSEWYNIFSQKAPILLHQGDKNSIICFQEAFAGLDRSSIWFQYGFNRPQGPVTQPKTSVNQIHKFTDYVLRKFNVPPSNVNENHESIAVLFSRKINRKILNENEVVVAVNSAYESVYSSENRLQLLNTDLSINSTRSILSAVRQADFVIGMHGSAMILTLFAKPGTAALELFPYGIKAELVSPLRALCQIHGIGLLYDSWSNIARENTVVHPHAPPLLGGIHHLTPEEQEEIEHIPEVPAVPCCHNPLYLYRMYQDTWINISDFSSVLYPLLLKQKRFSIHSYREDLLNKTTAHWYFPAPVNNIHCNVKDGALSIFWTEPVNVVDEHYDITVVIENGPHVTSKISSPEFTMNIPNILKRELKAFIWVKCIFNFRESHDTYKECLITL